MVPHFRNSIPQELLHDSAPAPHDRVTTPDASFSSSADDGARTPSSTNSQCDDSKPNASRASSIHDLLNPVTLPDSNFSTSFESHSAERANAQQNKSTVGSEVADSVELLDGCRNRSSSRSSHLKDSDACDSTNMLANSGGQHLGTQSRDAAAAVSSPAAPSRAVTEKLPSQPRPCSVNSALSRKRVFDEIEELALPSSQSSRIRLSMALDGAVKIRTTDEETPSPPKQRPQNQTALQKESLRRSHSAVTASDLVSEDQNHRTRPASGIFGRSRDARTWEFYCDSDARAALSAQAENENDGSAVGAINLIRSQSQNAKFRSEQEKGAALQPKVGGGNARKQAALAEQKPKMVRAMSSMARLCSKSKENIVRNSKTGKTSHERSPSGDSDKENWAPGTRSSDNPLRRVQASTSISRGVSQNQLPAASSEGSGKGRAHAREAQSGSGYGNAHSGKEGQEADSFGHGENEEEDLDCIQGLLSLSQGTWK
jgi:hypothetical protein